MKPTNSCDALKKAELSSQLRTIHEGKEVKTMKYEKPEVVLIASAIQSVRGGQKGSSLVFDQQPAPNNRTIGAYESDE